MSPIVDPRSESQSFQVRHDVRPGDLGWLVHLHGVLYAREYGFDDRFEAYVAEPLARFVLTRTERERLWIAERDERIVGSIAIVAATDAEAQLRWYLVDPSARGRGLGQRLLHEALDFCRGCGYESVFLWTVSALTAAARLYQSAGFRMVEEKAGAQWGVPIVEQKYVIDGVQLRSLPANALPRKDGSSP
jgi:GNAT superfamily N-acetyltransferase